MPTRKLTSEERAEFRSKFLETRRKRGLTELKREGVAFVAHLGNAGRPDTEAVATIVHFAIHSLRRAALDAHELRALKLVGELLSFVMRGDDWARSRAVEVGDEIRRLLLGDHFGVAEDLAQAFDDAEREIAGRASESADDRSDPHAYVHFTLGQLKDYVHNSSSPARFSLENILERYEAEVGAELAAKRRNDERSRRYHAKDQRPPNVINMREWLGNALGRRDE